MFFKRKHRKPFERKRPHEKVSDSQRRSGKVADRSRAQFNGEKQETGNGNGETAEPIRRFEGEIRHSEKVIRRRQKGIAGQKQNEFGTDGERENAPESRKSEKNDRITKRRSIIVAFDLSHFHSRVTFIVDYVATGKFTNKTQTV